MSKLRLVLLSDTHNLLEDIEVPDGDVLIHAGDATMGGRPREIWAFADIMDQFTHRHKIFIPGNHDLLFEQDPEAARNLVKRRAPGVTVLVDQLVDVEGLKVYGAPWQPRFMDWAFNVDPDKIKAKWDLIQPCDVLVTHGPPLGYGDLTRRGMRAGCPELLKAIERIKPRYHVCGHIHEGYGVRQHLDTTLINATCLNDRYAPVHQPIVLDVEVG